MKIGILCYPGHGGSGVVATELGKSLADRGHLIHFISYQQPFRLFDFHPRVFYHGVDVPSYPLFKYPPYTLALINKIAAVVDEADLDIIHAHYAIPHTFCALMAKQMAMAKGKNPKVVTTLHGTDITLVGSDPSFADITKHSIENSDAVTAVSQGLKKETNQIFQVKKDINVIYNFIDTSIYKSDKKELNSSEKTILHISNFRPVKRVDNVVRIFNLINQTVPSRLLLVGDGIEKYKVAQLVEELNLQDRVEFLGNQDRIIPILQEADLFLLPSEKESFGLVALEAMACGVPVVGSLVGGLPEVVKHGENGFLSSSGDIEEMAKYAQKLLLNRELYEKFSLSGIEIAKNSFESSEIIPHYENLYENVMQN